MNTATLVKTLYEDFVTHERDLSRPGLHAVASHRFGTWVHSLPRSLTRKPLVAAYRASYAWCRNIYGIELPYSAHLGRRVRVDHQGDIVVHGNSYIGDDCVLRQGVTLGMRSHPAEAPILRNGVSVGVRASILGRVTVGVGVRVAAHSLVTRNVPDFGRVSDLDRMNERAPSGMYVNEDGSWEAWNVGG